MSGSAYSVSASLNIGGNYQSVMRQLGRSLTGLNSQIMTTERNLARLSGLFPRFASIVTSSTGTATAGMSALRGSIQGTSASAAGLSRSLTTQASRLNALSTAAYRSAAAANAMAAAMQRLSQVPPPPRLPPPPRPGGGGGGGGGEGRRERGFGPTNREAYDAARATGRGIGNLVQAGGEVQQRETELRARGMSAADRATIRASIPRMMEQVPGITGTDVYAAVSESRNILGAQTPMDQIMSFSQDVLRTARLSSVYSGRPTLEAVRPFTQAIGQQGIMTGPDGGLDLEAGRKMLREYENAIVAFNSKGEGIDPRQWAAFQRRASSVSRDFSPEMITGPIASLIQEAGSGDTVGTAASAFAEQIVGNRMPKNIMATMRERGFFPRERQRLAAGEEVIARMEREGRMTPEEAAKARRLDRDRPERGDAVIGRGLARVRPDLWTQEVLTERARAAGKTTEEQQVGFANEIFSSRVTRRQAGQYLQDREIRNDIALVQNQRDMRNRGENPTDIMLREGYTNSLANMTGAFTSLLQTVGESPQVVTLLNETAVSLRSLASAAKEEGGNINFFVGLARGLVVDLTAFATTTGQELTAIRGSFNAFKEWLMSWREDYASLASWFGSVKVRLGFGGTGGNAPPEGVPSMDGGGRPGSPLQGEPGTGLRFPGIPGTGGGPGIPRIGPQLGGIQLNSFQPIAPGGRETVVNTALYLDSRQIADVVTRHQERAAGAPTRGADRYDPRRGGSNETVAA